MEKQLTQRFVQLNVEAYKMELDPISLSSSVSKEQVRYVMAHNPFEPLSRSTIDQMIASGELKEPRRSGKYKVWSKKYIAEKEGTDIESINKILRAIESKETAS